MKKSDNVATYYIIAENFMEKQPLFRCRYQPYFQPKLSHCDILRRA